MSRLSILAATTLAAALFLASCATPEARERIVTQTVEVPVYRPCEVALGPVSVLPVDEQPPKTDIFDQMKAALASIAILRADLKEARAAAEGCAGRP